MMATVIRTAIKKDWKLPGGQYTHTVINSGLERMRVLYPYEGMSDRRIVDFLVYQIYRCREVIASGGWAITWAFSDNAVAKYKKQFIDEGGKVGMNYYIDRWLADNGMSRNMLTNILSPSENSMKKYINPVHEEEIKARFFNKQAGYFLCQSSSTGWNPKSQYCPKCDYQNKCMKQTETKYPEITRLRKEQ